MTSRHTYSNLSKVLELALKDRISFLNAELQRRNVARSKIDLLDGHSNVPSASDFFMTYHNSLFLKYTAEYRGEILEHFFASEAQVLLRMEEVRSLLLRQMSLKKIIKYRNRTERMEG